MKIRSKIERMFGGFNRLIVRVSGGMAIGGVVFLLILVVVMIANIVGRRLGAPIPSVPEFSGVVLLMVICLGWAYTLRIGKNAGIPWLIEIAEHVRGQGRILMNTTAANARGIRDGDEIRVESEVGQVKSKVKLSMGVRPDTIVITGQFGQWAMPIAKDTGWVSQTMLTPIKYEWIDHVTGTMQGIVVKAKVYKA